MTNINFPAAGVQPEDRAIKIGEKYTFHSKILNEERPYWVYLPPPYDKNWFASKSYPVLYLLDGDVLFHSATGVVQLMGWEFQIPELIIVAIPNTNRTRDLTPTNITKGYDGNEVPELAASGGGGAFLQFLNEELIPHIESNYRTIPYRILVGHSLGGLLAMACFLRWPSVFQAYIAIDPSLWWDDEVLLRNAREMLPQAIDLHNALYISQANNLYGDADTKPEEGFFRICKDFVDLLKANPSPKLRTRLEYFGSEDHGSVVLISLFKGLLSIFEDFKAPIGSLFDPPSSISPEGYNAARIKAHFQRVSERLGIEFLPPEGFLNKIGWQMFQPALDKTIECFKLNVSNYPTSNNAYYSLAEAYAAKGEKQLAIDNYERSLELNPDNQDVKAGLEKVRQR